MQVLNATEAQGRAFELSDAPLFGRWLVIAATIDSDSGPVVAEWQPEGSEDWVPLSVRVTAAMPSAEFLPPGEGRLRLRPKAAGAVVHVVPCSPGFGARAVFADD